MEIIERNNNSAELSGKKNTVGNVLASLSLKTKLWISFSIAALAIISGSVTQISGMATVQKQVDKIVYDIQPSLLALQGLTKSVEMSTTALGFYLLNKDPVQKEILNQSLKDSNTYLQEVLKYPSFKLDPIKIAEIEAIKRDLAVLSGFEEQFLKLAGDPQLNYPAQEYAAQKLNPASQRILQSLGEMIFSEKGEDTSPLRREILSDINEMRYAWSNIMNSTRAFLAFRNKQSLSQLDIYKEKFDLANSRLEQNLEYLTFEQEDSFQHIQKDKEMFFQDLVEVVKIHGGDKWRTDAYIIKTEVAPIIAALSKHLDVLAESEAADAKAAEGVVHALYKSKRLSAVILGILFLALVSIMTWLMGSQIVRSIKQAAAMANSIAGGNLNNPITPHSTDETGMLLTSLDSMQTQLKAQLDKERCKSIEFGRFKKALDGVNTNVMFVDGDCKILYLNHSMEMTLRGRHTEFTKALPGFLIGNVIGSNIDVFVGIGLDVKSRLVNLVEPLVNELEFEGLHFRVTASPILDDNDHRIGTAFEWRDRSSQVEMEAQISDIVNKARSGDLSNRLLVNDSRSGYISSLCDSMNALLDVNEQVVRDLGHILAALASGDLTQKVTTNYEGSFEQLKKFANQTVDKLTCIMGRISGAANGMNAEADEIAKGNDNLNHRTTEQASSIEETAASMDQMTGIVRKNAENVIQANDLASKARLQAEKGGDVVRDTNKAMAQINQASSRITEITGVIDEIAFQTNLLALNAAVEAAHAGEQGKGFAVVASEVRMLAQRSSEAAKEINELIEDSANKVNEGTKLVNISGVHLEEIIDSVSSVSDLIKQIAVAGEEQTTGIEQVNQAVVQFDKSLQENSSLVQQTADSSGSLSQQSTRLTELVSYFKFSQADSQKITQAPARGNTTAAAVAERRSRQRPWSNKANSTSKPEANTKLASNDWKSF